MYPKWYLYTASQNLLSVYLVIIYCQKNMINGTWDKALWEQKFSAVYMERLSVLPFIHGDPFDRLIIATAVEEALTLITHDEKIQKYSLNILLHRPQERLAHRIHENTPFHTKSTSPSRLMPSLNLTTNLPQNRSYPSGFMYKRGYGFLCSSQSVRLNTRNPIRS